MPKNDNFEGASIDGATDIPVPQRPSLSASALNVLNNFAAAFTSKGSQPGLGESPDDDGLTAFNNSLNADLAKARRRPGLLIAIRGGLPSPEVPAQASVVVSGVPAQTTAPAQSATAETAPLSVRIRNSSNFENADAVDFGNGQIGRAVRTEPGNFTAEDLALVKGKLKRGGVEAHVLESVKQPGKFYLAVPVNNTAPDAAYHSFQKITATLDQVDNQQKVKLSTALSS